MSTDGGMIARAIRLLPPGRITPKTVLGFLSMPALRDVTALGFGSLASQVILIIATPICLRLYTPADFGLYALCYSLIMLVARIATWKIERLIVVVPARRTAVRLLSALVLIAVCVAAALLALVPLVQAIGARFSPELHDGAALIWLAPLSVLIIIISTGTRSYAIRVGLFRAVASAQIARAVIFAMVVITVAVAWPGLGGKGGLILLSGQVTADASALLLQLGLNDRAAHLSFLRLRIRTSLDVLRNHGKLLGALGISEIVNVVNLQIPILTVTLAFGAAFGGWYYLANTLVFVPCSVVAMAVSEVINQRLSRHHATRRPYSHIVLQATLGMAGIGLIPFLMLGTIGPILLPWVMGPQWIGAATSIRWLTIASYSNFIGTPGGNIAIIVQARRYILVWNSARLAASATLAVLAALGLLSYSSWLAAQVATESVAHLAEAVSGVMFARASEKHWHCPAVA